MTNLKWMLYGCYGYSGELILKEAIRKGLHPIIGGRSKKKVSALAQKYKLAFRVFDLSSQTAIEDNIADCHLVFNSAGPYSSTCIPMLKACLNRGVHNLSLAGEIPILEALHGYHQEAKEKGTVVAVGLGFDVLPTDSMSNHLKHLLPDATHLTLGMDGPNDMSRGSMKEFFEQIGEHPFWVRRNGKLVASKPRTTYMDFGNGKKLASTIAWGDTASAFHSTGIPNIEVFAAISKADWLTIKTLDGLSFLFKFKSIQKLANTCIDCLLSGPDEETREKGQTFMTAVASNGSGEKIKINMSTPTGYKITYLGAVYAIEHMLKQAPVEGGYYTPAQLLGEKAICNIEGVSEMIISRP